MDEPEGFFPERELLAYRRSLRQAAPPVAGDAGANGFPWWLQRRANPQATTGGPDIYKSQSSGAFVISASRSSSKIAMAR